MKNNNSKRYNKTSSKKDAMSGCSNMLMILLVVLVIIYVFKKYQKQKNKTKKEGFQAMDSEGAMSDQIENFIAYPDEQKFCPNLYNSASSFWTTLPKEHSNGLMAKFCCTSCYYRVSKEIICGTNMTGEYKICTLQQNDIDNLEQYYQNNFKNKSLFSFDNNKFNSLKGSKVLKMKKDNVYYPIQILKTKEQLKAHEKEPTIADQLYKQSSSYKCNKK
tara:strand:+ start:1024 stop:1677 length:654 start_codon:yes stop_codon:yes gene_type:complete